jgi:SnoaL-like domain
VATVADLMERMLQGVFNEPDAAHRATAIDETFTEDVVFRDAEGTVTGRDALAAKVTALLAQGPGFVFVHDGPLREIPGALGIRAWKLGPVGGTPVIGGLDVAVVRDGLIATLYTVLDGGEDQA